MKIEFRQFIPKWERAALQLRRFWNATAQKITTKAMFETKSALLATFAVLLTLSIAYWLLPTLWFWISWEVSGAALVAIGCIGEWILIKRPATEHGPNHHSREVQFVLMVAVGVTMEFLGMMHAIPEAIRLNREVAAAVERTTVTESNNLVLRSNVAALELQLIETSNSVTKIDPLNLPITSIRANAILFVNGTTNFWANIDL